MFILDEFQRLFLSRGKGGNYINAVFSDVSHLVFIMYYYYSLIYYYCHELIYVNYLIQSFQAHKTYVVTQMPLPQTILDFWQLILENEIQAIVMLNEMDPEDKVSECHDDDELVTTQSIAKFSEVKFQLLTSALKLNLLSHFKIEYFTINYKIIQFY